MAKKYQILFSHDIVITYKSFMFVTLILHLYGTLVVMMENHARGHLKKTHVFFCCSCLIINVGVTWVCNIFCKVALLQCIVKGNIFHFC